MNAKQQATMQQIKNLILAKESHGGRTAVQVKKEEITEYESFVSYFLTVGMVDDEGTLASVLCRDSRHFFIGKNGGVKLVTVDNNGKNKSPSNVRGLTKAIAFLPF